MRWHACLLLVAAGCAELFGLEPVGHEPDGDAGGASDGGNGRAMLVDDFEGGRHPRWTNSYENGDGCTVTTDQAASGTHSLVCTTDDTSGTRAALSVAFEDTPTIRVRMAVRFATLSDFYLAFIQTMHVSPTETRRLAAADFYPNSRIDVWNHETLDSVYHPQVIALDTWYRVDFTARMSSTDGSISLALDGSSGLAELGPVDTTDLPINQLLIGITLVNKSIEQLTVYIDDVEISEL